MMKKRASIKKEETNDIVQFLLPQLEQIGISLDKCKIDVTTEKNGNKRGDIWISLKKHSDRDFEDNIIALIEAKHKNATIGDMDWRDAMRQGREKSLEQGLPFYIATNCRSEIRFYNSYNDEEIILDGKVIVKIVPLEVLQKIQSQTTQTNSYIIHKASEVTRPLSESGFRTTLRTLADIYRSAGLKKGDERIDPTISFVVLKYISENEEQKRTLNKVIKLWGDFQKIANDKEIGDLKVEFDTTVKLIWCNETYTDNIYKDFKDLIVFPTKLKNEHFKKIYNELKEYSFHGANFDLFGVIYEEFASQTKKKEFGQFYTRRHITGIIARLLLRNETTPRDLKICDPACGTGGFLTEAYKALETSYSLNGKLNDTIQKQLREKTFWGYDNDEKSVARTKLNMFLVGEGHIHIFENDSLMEWNEKINWNEDEYDYIMTNPPMGQYEGEANIHGFDFTNERRYELLFAEKIVKITKFGVGEIALVINDGSLEAPSRKNWRLKLLKACDIHAIVSLTKFAFAPYTKEKTYVMFMQKKQVENVGEIQKSPIWHFIVDNDGFANSDKRFRTKYDDDLPILEDLFDNAIKFIKSYNDKIKFNRGRSQFERDVNEREKLAGLYGRKCGYVEMESVCEENFHNLLSEFHLRPIIKNKISTSRFNDSITDLLHEISELNKQIEKLNEEPDENMSSLENIGQVFNFFGGNSGLTEEFIYNNQPTNDEEKLEIYSGATERKNFVGFVSVNAVLNNKNLIILNAPAILIVRKGKAGKMIFIKNGKFSLTDDAYVIIPKEKWVNKIDLRWFMHQYQELFYNLVTSKSDNATFNKEYAEKQNVVVLDHGKQLKISNALTKLDEAIDTLNKLSGQIDELLRSEIID
jgi:type I restriction enzyme M protein